MHRDHEVALRDRDWYLHHCEEHSHPDNLIPYTQEMSTELDELLAGVEIDQ